MEAADNTKAFGIWTYGNLIFAPLQGLCSILKAEAADRTQRYRYLKLWQPHICPTTRVMFYPENGGSRQNTKAIGIWTYGNLIFAPLQG